MRGWVMGLFDWVEVGLGDKNLLPSWYTGSFSVTIGQAVESIFGGSTERIFGTDATLVVDLEDMLLERLAHALPTTTALLGGTGGYVEFVYGSNTTATFIG